MTGNEIVERALRLIGKLAESETPTGQAAQDARVYLNDIIDQWQADDIMVFAEKENTALNLTANTQDYTIGSGATFAITRPVRINRATVVPDSTATKTIEIAVRILTPQGWAALRQKSTTAAYPYALYYDRAMDSNSRGTVSVYPIPTNTNAQLVLWTEDQLNQFTDLTTNFTFPPGYARALRENLAVAMAAEYGIQVPSQLVQSAKEALEVIERTNAKHDEMIVDPALWSGTGGYNIFTDEG